MTIVEPVYKGIGERLRLARKAKGLTQGQLGEMIGLGYTSIANMERGEQRIMLHVLLDIAKALDVRADWFLGGSAEDPKPDNDNLYHAKLLDSLKKVRKQLEGAEESLGNLEDVVFSTYP
jgi:transcriptional regulator with XRE-family HTH domain